MAMPIVDSTRLVVGGVDTHSKTHTAAVVDHLGGQLGCETFPADSGGYVALVGWMRSFGALERVGVEGTGSYRKGLCRHLNGDGLVVLEVDRPNRQVRHRVHKSDPTDALAAARAAVSGVASGRAKSGDGPVEAMRVTLVAKRSTRAHRIEVITQLRHLVVCGPDRLRERLEDLSTIMVVNTPAAMRPRPSGDIAADTTVRTIVELARRARDLGGHAKVLDARLNDLVAPLALELLHAPAAAPTPPTPF